MQKNNEIEFPSCWEEIKPVEWECLLRLMWTLAAGYCTLKDVKMEWSRYVLSNRGMRTARVGDKVYLLIYNLAETLDWMWEEGKDEKGNVLITLKFDSTYNLLPHWRGLRGPMNHGGDLTFGEFRNAVILMNEYEKERDQRVLDNLTGMLYRKPGGNPNSKNFDGNFRVPFDSAKMNYYAYCVKEMKPWLKWGIYTWFSSLCHYIISGGIFIVDGKEYSFAELFGKEKTEDENDGKNLGMNGILFSISESGVFGTAKDVDNTPLFKVFMKLLSDKWKIDELKKK